MATQKQIDQARQDFITYVKDNGSVTIKSLLTTLGGTFTEQDVDDMIVAVLEALPITIGKTTEFQFKSDYATDADAQIAKKKTSVQNTYTGAKAAFASTQDLLEELVWKLKNDFEQSVKGGHLVNHVPE